MTPPPREEYVGGHGATPVIGRPSDLGEAEREVHALDGAARGALGEVVDRGDRHQAARVGVHRDLQVHGVGPQRGAGARPDALGQEVHERLVGVGLGVGLDDLGRGRRRGRRARGEDAARQAGRARG